MKVINRIKEIRRNQNITQADMVKILGVSRQTIIAIENDKYNPSLELTLKMARLFKLSVEEIFKLEMRSNENDIGYRYYNNYYRNRNKGDGIIYFCNLYIN
ncbi:hypothetical protein IGI67_001358 [Enterococcus sp. AZ196]